MDAIDGGDLKEIKNISGRRSIRDNYNNYEEISSRKKVNIIKDRSISEPPKSTYTNNNNHKTGRLKTIREKHIEDINNQGSSEDDEEFEDFSNKSNSQLNESDLDLEIPESASQTPTPTLLTSKSRRINSETNLNDSKRRLTGFMGNRSKRFCASTSELNFASHLDTHKSLFSPKNNQSSRSGSLYGSNMSLNSTNSRLFMANSPFYNGKTMFGGASSYPKRDINQHKVLRTPIQMRPSSSLSNSSNTSTKSEGGVMPESNAAKRILEIMTQFSGTLKETRNMGSNINSMIKIPGLVQNRKRFGEEDLHLDRSISLTRPTAPYSRPIVTSKNQQQQSETPSILLLNNNSKTPQIPTMSQLLKMKRLQNNTEKVREIANRSENFLNHIHEYKLPSQTDEIQSNNSSSTNLIASNTTTSSSSAFKMKSNITKNLLRNDKGNDNELPPVPLNLPNIQLPQLKSIPKFDIKLPESSTSTAPTATITSNTKSISTSPSVKASQPSISSFSSIDTFKTARNMSETTEISTTNKTVKINSSTSSFIFSKPIQLNANHADHQIFKVSTASFQFTKPNRIIDEDVEMVTKKNTIDIPSMKPASDNLFKSLVAQQKSLWECDSCLTRNDMDRTKCLCCDAIKRDSGIASLPSSTVVSTKDTSTSQPQSDDLFKKLAAQQKKSQWECSECMSKNDLDKEKCMCCETPKPGSKPSSTSTTSAVSSSFKFGMPAETTSKAPSDDLFKNLAAQQKKSQWECSDCMTSNDMSKEKCLCCEAPKPGSEKSAKSQTTSSSFSFGAKPSIDSSSSTQKFSFGMPATTSTPFTSSKVDADFKKIIEKQNANWECSACMTRNDHSRSKCICCEQAKPGSSDNKSHFSFGSKVSSSVSLPAPSEVKFSFGVQPILPSKSDSIVATETTTSTNNDKKENEKTVDKTDEVDNKPKSGFTFGAVSSNTPSSTFTFKAPAASSPATSISASFTIKSPKADEKKENENLTTDNSSNNKIVGIDKTPIFSFGSSASSTKIGDTTSEKKTVGFGISTAKPIAEEKRTPVAAINNAVEEKKSIGGFSFGTPSLSSSPADNLKTNGGFSFGGFSKPKESKSEEIKPASTGGFQFSSSTNSPFSSQPIAASTTPAIVQPSNSFTFGSQKPAPSENSDQPKPAVFGTFGNTQSTTSAVASPVFGQNPAVPTFGSSSLTKSNEIKPIFAFGNAKPAASNNSTMIFGSNLNSTPSVTPIFGAASSNTTPTFGSNLSTLSNNNNNESGFGSKMVGFGNIQQTSTSANQPQKRAFDFGSSEVPQKKFDFDSQQQSQSQQQPSSTPFQFNAQPEAVKPAFNFSATSAPQTFSFTGMNSNNSNVNAIGSNNVQENLFQFGANTSTTTQGIFAFGVNAQPQQQQQPAPVMQFGAASAPTIAIPGINTFGAQSAANAPQRRILKAARRTTRR